MSDAARYGVRKARHLRSALRLRPLVIQGSEEWHVKRQLEGHIVCCRELTCSSSSRDRIRSRKSPHVVLIVLELVCGERHAGTQAERIPFDALVQKLRHGRILLAG